MISLPLLRKEISGIVILSFTVSVLSMNLNQFYFLAILVMH